MFRLCRRTGEELWSRHIVFLAKRLFFIYGAQCVVELQESELRCLRFFFFSCPPSSPVNFPSRIIRLDLTEKLQSRETIIPRNRLVILKCSGSSSQSLRKQLGKSCSFKSLEGLFFHMRMSFTSSFLVVTLRGTDKTWHRFCRKAALVE